MKNFVIYLVLIALLLIAGIYSPSNGTDGAVFLTPNELLSRAMTIIALCVGFGLLTMIGNPESDDEGIHQVDFQKVP